MNTTSTQRASLSEEGRLPARAAHESDELEYRIAAAFIDARVQYTETNM